MCLGAYFSRHDSNPFVRINRSALSVETINNGFGRLNGSAALACSPTTCVTAGTRRTFSSFLCWRLNGLCVHAEGFTACPQ